MKGVNDITEGECDGLSKKPADALQAGPPSVVPGPPLDGELSTNCAYREHLFLSL